MEVQIWTNHSTQMNFLGIPWTWQMETANVLHSIRISKLCSLYPFVWGFKRMIFEGKLRKVRITCSVGSIGKKERC